MRMRRVVALVVVVALAGCSAMRRDKYCKVALPVWGAALGGAGAGLGVGLGHDDADAAEIGGAAAGGMLLGGLLGFAAGQALCEEEAPPPAPAVAAPPAPAPPARGTKIAEIPGPNFAFDKATLTPAGRELVAAAAGILKQNPSTRVSVDGHTDSIGSDAYNQRLSERRARAVADALVADGIARSRLHVQGFGESKPVADNATAEGRAKNRRVEIVVE